MKNKRQSLMLSPEVKSLLDSIKNNSKNADELALFLYGLLNPRLELKGTAKAELQLQRWLYMGHERPITATELQKYTSVDFNACKKVTEAYLSEIEEHNKNIK